MRIPRDFDRWMFDYKEGNLSQSEMSYFEEFIANNPQYEHDFDAWDYSYVSNHNMSYPGMHQLMKERTSFNWLGWVASIGFIISVTSLMFIFTKSISNVYQLRQVTNLMEFEPSISNLNLYHPQTNYNQHTNTAAKINNGSSNNATRFNLILKSNTLRQTNTKETIAIENQIKTYSKSKNNNQIEIELNKINLTKPNTKGVGFYISNPKFKSITKNKLKKSKSNYGSISYKFKKVIKTIEKMAGYPVGLVNLYDPEILTPDNNLLTSNFGFTGSFGKPRFEIRYRNQWLGGDNNLQSGYINFDTYVKALKSGVGVVFNHQNFNQGAFSDYNLNLIYAPKFQVYKNIYFEPAIKLSMGVLTVNTSNLNQNSVYEVSRGKLINFNETFDNSLANNVWYKDYGVGFLINAKKFYIGFNADNLAKHDQPIYGDNVRASIKYTAITGVDYQSRNKKMILSPFITYTNQNLLSELWVGANIKYNWLTFGGAYSSLNDYSASLGVKFRNFKLIYQYDKTISFINNDRFASHNLGVRINAKQKRKR